MPMSLIRYAHATYSGSPPDQVVGAPVDLEPLTGIAGRLVPLPGHTKGSLVAVTGDVALVGDLLRGSLVGASATRHLYMCDLDGNDRDIATLLKDLAPRAALVFTGHFGPVSRESVLENFPVR